MADELTGANGPRSSGAAMTATPYGAILFHAVDEVVAQAVVEADYKGLDGKFLAQYRQKVFRAHASERFVETQQYDILRAGL